MNFPYKHVTACGTFDHFHAGHEAFLLKAFEYGGKVSIGISTDTFIKNKKYSRQIQQFEVRKEALKDFLECRSLIDRSIFFELHDTRGIALGDTTLEAIVVTSETQQNAKEINKLRKVKKLKQLEIIKVPFVKGKDKKIIRSSRIRAGEINRLGEKYKNLFTGKSTLSLPSSLRDTLRNPLGIVIEGTDAQQAQVAQKATEVIRSIKPVVTITVGDIATQSLRQQGLSPDISVIDYKTKRSEIPKDHEIDSSFITSYNPAGTISKSAVYAFNSHLHTYLIHQSKHHLIIRGEEDLLALPAILLAPLGSVIVYGQAGLGMVIVNVTEGIKQKVEDMVRQFK